MSFRCQECDEPQTVGTKPIRKVIQTRPAHYRNYIKVGENKFLKETSGTEIVKERFVCASCT